MRAHAQLVPHQRRQYKSARGRFTRAVNFVQKRGVSTMASVKCLIAVDAFQHKHSPDSAGGTRAVFILGSLASLPSEDVVFRRSITLSDEDKNTLSKGLALPPDRWTDLDVILTKYAQDENVSIGPQELFTQENEVSCGTVLAKLRDFFSSSTDKDGGRFQHCSVIR